MTSLWSKVTAFFKGGNASSGKTKKSIDGKNQPDFTVHKAARTYEEIVLGDDREETPTVDYTVERKPRNYEEIVLPEDNRLSQVLCMLCIYNISFL